MTQTAPAIARLIVSVEQLDRSLVLYRDVLGLRLTRQSGEFVWLSTREGVEVLFHERPTTASETAVSIGFVADDLDGVVARWASEGGRVIDPIALQPWGERMAVLADADGHVVCVSGAPA